MNSSARIMTVIVLAVLVSAGISLYNRSGGDEVVPWRKDFAAAQVEASQPPRRMLVYFTAGWCGPCQWMSRNTWIDDRVKNSLESIVPVKVDVDQNEAIARQFNISSMPTFVLVDATGKQIRRESGQMTAEEFVAWVTQ